MSFNKRFLPSTSELENTLNERGPKFFYETYVKSPDMTIGSEDSIQFVAAFKRKYENDKGFKSIY
jgi:hypothetical protein